MQSSMGVSRCGWRGARPRWLEASVHLVNWSANSMVDSLAKEGVNRDSLIISPFVFPFVWSFECFFPLYLSFFVIPNLHCPHPRAGNLVLYVFYSCNSSSTEFSFMNFFLCVMVLGGDIACWAPSMRMQIQVWIAATSFKKQTGSLSTSPSTL